MFSYTDANRVDGVGCIWIFRPSMHSCIHVCVWGELAFLTILPSTSS